MRAKPSAQLLMAMSVSIIPPLKHMKSVPVHLHAYKYPLHFWQLRSSPLWFSAQLCILIFAVVVILSPAEPSIFKWEAESFCNSSDYNTQSLIISTSMFPTPAIFNKWYIMGITLKLCNLQDNHCS